MCYTMLTHDILSNRGVGPSGSSNSSDGQLLEDFKSADPNECLVCHKIIHLMKIAALVVLSIAVAFGLMLLMPRQPLSSRLPRRHAAAMHGAAGAAGLAIFILAAGSGAPRILWLAGVLLCAGLIVGVTMFLTGRHRRAPPALILALHVVFAGIGYLLCVGSILN